MDFYDRKNLWKIILLTFAILIGATTLWYTEGFLETLRNEERKKVEQWGNAMQMIISVEENSELTLASQILQSNTTIPVILTDANKQIIDHRNLPERIVKDSLRLHKKFKDMQAERDPITVNFGNNQTNYIYYQNSNLLQKLRLYPVILLVVISIFITIAYVAFSRARKSEQNQVWNGLAKETAHQIGTPLSSLMGWIELLRMKEGNTEMVEEMEKDLNRLNTITDRFSKIGSKPTMAPLNVAQITEKAVQYLHSRVSKNIKITFENNLSAPHPCRLNAQLFSWVIENLIRNATDAIEKEGEIKVSINELNKGVCIEVKDNGKGIPLNLQRTVFRPGYSTKKRGWGLGLSLARRIVEDYHHGKIYVAQSEPGKGTTFRISLKT